MRLRGDKERITNIVKKRNAREIIRVENLHVSFGSKDVLRGLNLSISRGDNYVIIGHSGCGKSVLLRCILGLIRPDSGAIYLWGQNIMELTEEELLPLRMRMAIVFQSGALFNSMTIADNVALALRQVQHLPENDIMRIVGERLSWVNLPGSEQTKVSQLSGGMRKRVAIARALSTDPEVIFYDEPTTGLDPPLADTIDELIYSLSRKLKNTSVTVTHDMVAANYFGDRIGLVHEGRILFEGTLKQFNECEDKEIRSFLGRKQNHSEWIAADGSNFESLQLDD